MTPVAGRGESPARVSPPPIKHQSGAPKPRGLVPAPRSLTHVRNPAPEPVRMLKLLAPRRSAGRRALANPAASSSQRSPTTARAIPRKLLPLAGRVAASLFGAKSLLWSVGWRVAASLFGANSLLWSVGWRVWPDLLDAPHLLESSPAFAPGLRVPVTS